MSVQAGGTRHLGTPTSTSSGSAWDPTTEQAVEADTLFLLDPDKESLITAHTDGSLEVATTNGSETMWSNSTGKVLVVSGKYTSGTYNRKGIKPNSAANGYLWFPCEGVMPTNEFTIEMNVKGDYDWADNTNMANQYLFGVGDPNTVGSYYYIVLTTKQIKTQLVTPVVASINGSTLSTRFTTTNTNTSGSFVTGTYTANNWYNVAVTYKSQTLKIYIDGVLKATGSSVVMPNIWGSDGVSTGIMIGGFNGVAATKCTISDLRISRQARVPTQTDNTAKIIPNGDNIVTVYKTSPTGTQINKYLRGALSTDTYYYQNTAGETSLKDAVSIIRTDKLIHPTPILASGTPDATHPTVGYSGQYCYDWQVVDRTLGYIYNTLGAEAMVSIDATPSILAPSDGTAPSPTAPFSGTRLTSDVAFTATFPSYIPNDYPNFTSYTKIVKDLIYHIVHELGYNVQYWSVWNEPNSSTFWNAGTMVTGAGDTAIGAYCKLYGAIATMIHNLNTSLGWSLKVGGPELSTPYGTNMTWIGNLLSYCHTNSIPLDFIAWHYYSRNVNEIAVVRKSIDYYLANGYPQLTTPEIIVGEGHWGTYSSTPLPFDNFNTTNSFYTNDWHAAFTATSLIEMQNNNMTIYIHTRSLSDPSVANSGYTYSSAVSKYFGLVTPSGPLSNANVNILWKNMDNKYVLNTATQGDPGISVMAASDNADGSGKTYILISSFHYRSPSMPVSNSDINLTIIVPGMSNSASITSHYIIDSSHSNVTNAGSQHASLETTSSHTNNWQISLSVKPRSVHMLIIQ